MSDRLAPWTCPRCGKQATANLDALGPLGTILCTCGTRSRPERWLCVCGQRHDGPRRKVGAGYLMHEPVED